MNLKILGSLMTIGLVSAGVGYGTFAFFSDTETSTQNIFTAGDLDLTLNGLNGVTATIVGTNFAPGDSTSGSILLRNEGSIFTGDAQGHTVDLDFSIATTVTDDAGNPGDADDGGVSPIAFNRYLTIQSFTYGGVNLLTTYGIGDVDGDGRPSTLADLQAFGPIKDLADPLASGQTLSIQVGFDTDGPNYLKRDQVKIAFTFFLSQTGEIDLA